MSHYPTMNLEGMPISELKTCEKCGRNFLRVTQHRNPLGDLVELDKELRPRYCGKCQRDCPWLENSIDIHRRYAKKVLQ